MAKKKAAKKTKTSSVTKKQREAEREANFKNLHAARLRQCINQCVHAPAMKASALKSVDALVEQYADPAAEIAA